MGLFNPKAKQWIDGRKNIFNQIERDFINNTSPIAWFHSASLGEFEQGKPVIEAFRQAYPQYKIVLTFFSPSGYEVRKNYKGADFIYYLPADTTSNAQRFVKLINPSVSFFIKYEFWRNYLEALKNNNTPIISFSTIFREDQVYFKSNGFNRETLSFVDHFVVQNDLSGQLLSSISLDNWEKGGDTRFDSVLALRKNLKSFDYIKAFKGDSKLMIVGSSWKEDLEILLPIINHSKLKFVIAPHEIHENEIEKYRKTLKVHSVRYSNMNELQEDTKVIFIDSIGILSSLYQYADFAFVGGAFRTGLHNTLEPATYGIPVIFGSYYSKFQEAIDLIERKGAFSVTSTSELQNVLEKLINDQSFYNTTCAITATYVTKNTGATTVIMNALKKYTL